MGGPNLEVFKFGLYLFVPIFALVHFSDAEWYRNNVLPYKDRLFPSDERLTKTIPSDQNGVREELEKIRNQKLARRFGREKTEPETKQ